MGGETVINGAHSLLRAIKVVPKNLCLGSLLVVPITHWWPIMTGGAEYSTCALALDRGEHPLCAVEAERWGPECFLLAVSEVGYGGTGVEFIRAMSIGSVEDFEPDYMHVCLHRKPLQLLSSEDT